MVSYLLAAYKVSIARACNVVGLHRSMWYYQAKKDDSEVVAKLTELAEDLPTRGFDVYYNRIRTEGLWSLQKGEVYIIFWALLPKIIPWPDITRI